MAEMKCLRCAANMEFRGREKFQLGDESYHSGLLAVITAESMVLNVYKCPECGKVEFFGNVPQKTAAVSQTNWTCSACGEYNAARVQTCQSCGVTRQWSDSQKK